MLKVFLVDDEAVVREGLRDNIPWQQYGYKFVGEASDGEMALPLIRKNHPNVVITDIKMPFMDGIELSRIVGKEFPDIKIIVMSGYDDFDYAQQALNAGVEQYLLKPITRNALQKVLEDMRTKIESEEEQKNYLKKFENEMSQHEQLYLRNFLEKVCEGKMTASEIYEEAGKRNIDISAAYYNMVMVQLTEAQTPEPVLDTCADKLMRELMKHSYFSVVPWNINVFVVLISGESDNIGARTEKCVKKIEEICQLAQDVSDYQIAGGRQVDRFSRLNDCYKQLYRLYSYRFFAPDRHVLTEDLLDNAKGEQENKAVENLATSQVDPGLIRRFLEEGEPEDVAKFVETYLGGLASAVNSKLFRDYMVLNIRFTVLAYVESIGVSQEEFLSGLSLGKNSELSVTAENLSDYMTVFLSSALQYKDQDHEDKSRKLIKQAVAYINENFANENLSLNNVAEAVDVTPNYFSAVFSQEMKLTFIEYVTERRMTEAKRLLEETSLHTGEIAANVGYRDPHYFSFVFKKTEGLTPREYRNLKSK